MKVPMTEVIAVRRLMWEGVPSEVLVKIGKPAETTGATGEFYCPIQTTGLGKDDFVTAIFGIDGFQAIELAVRFVCQRLSGINAKNGHRLRWLGEPLPKKWEQQEG